jgi:ATP-dependent Lhr-like helicase
MESTGKLVEGEFRPGGSGQEWCDSGVLRALRQKSLARLRKEVEPVEPAALGRLYLNWQHVESPRRGRNALFDAIAQIQGVAIPASVLETQVLPARVEGYHPRDLDLLMSSGAVIWTGCEPLGLHDGRVALYLTEDAEFLMSPPTSSQSPRDAVAGRTAEGHLASGLISEDSPAQQRPSTSLHDRIRRHLATRGASFFPQIQQATGGFPPEVLEALWDLVWAGEVTNDTLQPLRAVVDGGDSKSNTPEARARAKVRHMRPGRRAPVTAAHRNIPPDAVGRWSLVRDLVPGVGQGQDDAGIQGYEHGAQSSDSSLTSEERAYGPEGITPVRGALGEGLGVRPDADALTHTDRMHARVNQLLERYGVLTREAVQAEGISGGFSSIYGVLKAMEDAGLIRRGYFVSGLGATQFALPGAIDRLRSLREPPDRMQTVMLAATDPANPYGAALRWPEAAEGRRPMRQAGAYVMLVDGALAAWMPRSERQLVTFLDNVPDREPGDVAYEIAKTLADLVTSLRRRAVLIEEVNGRPPRETPMGNALLEAGFTQSSQGFLKKL